ncbi:MAG: TonB-dependent siderophore receptor [Marinagarivorans sp.]|nr:TonB-dependent siderophore receptor [Marinagarivorans sp.]
MAGEETKTKKNSAIETIVVEGLHTHANNDAGALGDKRVIDTPFSITVVDSAELAKRGAKSVRQIFINDASFYTPASSNTTDWWGMSIRGLPVRNTYADDFPVMLYWGGDFPVEVVDSVTSLKGATGFMYGFGSPGGAVNYRLKKPLNTPQTTVNVEARSDSVVSAHIDNNGAIAEDLKYRVNLATEKGTGYNGADVNRDVMSLGIEKNFGDKLEWSSNVIYQNSKLEHEPFQFYLSDYDFIGSNGELPDVTYDYEIFNVDDSFYASKTLIASTGFKYLINDNWNLKYQYGYSKKEHDSKKSFADLYNQEGDYGGNIYNFAGVLKNYFNQAIITGNVHTGTITHELNIGIGQQKNTTQYGNFYYASTPDFLGNIYKEQTFLAGPRPDLSYNPIANEVTQNYAFLSDTIKLHTDWQLIIGARHTDYKKPDLDNNPSRDSGYKTSVITPTLALLYKPAINATLYMSYVEGLEPGSTAGTRYANAGETLDAKVSNQFEIGTKYQSKKLSLEVAVFKIERAETMDTNNNGQLYLTQDGLTTFQGIDLNSAYQLTPNLKIGAGFVKLDSSIDDVSEANKSIEGNRPANAAEWQAVANVEYAVAAIEGLRLHGVIRYYGDTYVANTNQLKVPNYSVVNTGLSYKFTLWNQDASLNGNLNNLLNEKYWAGGGYGAGNMGEAINGSLSLQVSW